MSIIVDIMDLDKSDIPRLKKLIEGLEEQNVNGICIPIRAILHRKNTGKFDWADEWELADDWDGVRHREKKEHS